MSSNVCLCDPAWDGASCDLSVRVLDEVALLLVANNSQAIEIPAIGAFSTLTVEFWILPTFTVDGNQMILEAVESAPGALSFSLHDGLPTVTIEGSDPVSFTKAINLGVWSHIAISFDAVDHLMRLYIDGQKADQLDLVPESVALVTSRLGGTLRKPFKGYMKELRVWSSVRSSLQISTAAYQALTGTEDSLEVLYPLSGPLSANTVYIEDLAGSHGTRVLGAVWARAPTAPPGPRQLPPIYHHAKPPVQ